MFDISLIHGHPFYELTALMVLAAAVGIVGLALRQPMIVSFIAVGIISGPSALGLVTDSEQIDLLSELGIAVLLFLVGLKLDLKLVNTLGKVALATGLGQILFTSLLGFLIGIALGLDMVTALYIAVALTFSSTIIIIKLLSDKREVDSLHGRIAVGFLIVQDIFVILAMIILSAVGVGTHIEADGAGVSQITSVLGYGLAMLAFVGVFIKFVALPLTSRIARSPELLVIFAISWAALLAALGEYFGFGKELGGLLAGVSLASTPYREAIISRLSPLRDFLLLFFFIALGSQLDMGVLGVQLFPAIVFSLFVLIGNPLIVMAIMGYMGYRKRTGFLAGLTVAQISEFSLIFVGMGQALGHINNSALGLVTLVGLITIAMSVYMITYSSTLYRYLEKFLGPFERKKPYRENESSELDVHHKHDVILFGGGRYGGAIAGHLIKAGYKVMIVDFNPDEVSSWGAKGFDAVYGDACDHEFISSLPLQDIKWVISAMPQHDMGVTHEDSRLTLMDGLKAAGYSGRVAVSTHHARDIEHLKIRGADVVLLPFDDAAREAVGRIISFS